MFILQIPHSSSKKPKIWKMQTKICFVIILPQFLTNIKIKLYLFISYVFLFVERLPLKSTFDFLPPQASSDQHVSFEKEIINL